MILRRIIFVYWALLLISAPLFAQPADRLCGPKCLAAACESLGVKTSVDEIAALCGVDDTGSTLAGLWTAAKAKGLHAIAMKMGASDMARLACPTIAHLWGNHFVLVNGSSGDTLTVSSPPEDAKPEPIDQFQEEYSGFALLVSRDESVFPVPKAEGADLRLSAYSWDMGRIEAGDHVERGITCTNAGTSDLIISQITSTCGCTTGSMSADRIPSGATGQLTVRYDATERHGRQKQMLLVHSNDPITPIAQVEVLGLVAPPGLLVSPRAIEFGEVRRSQPQSRQVFIPRSQFADLRVESVKCEAPSISAGFSEKADGSGYLVVVKMHSPLPVGPVSSKLTIYTNHPKHSDVEVPVTAVVKGDIGVFPDMLFFGLLKKGDCGHRRLKLRTASDQPLKIERIDSSLAFLKVWAEPKIDGKEYQLIAVLQRTAPVGYVKSEVTVHTDDPQQPQIKLPVYALIEE